MVTEQQILEEAKYIISGKTMDETALHFRCSVRTIQLHINNHLKCLAEKNKENKLIYEAVLDAKNKTAKEKMIYGGSVGAKKPTWTKEETEAIARHMIECNLTVRQASINLGLYENKYDDIPKSTLYDRLKRGIKDPILLSHFNSFLESHKPGSINARKK